MSDIFKIDDRELQQYIRQLRDTPEKIKPAVRGVLNSLAFTTRKNDINNIKTSMIVRSQRFVESSLRVEQAKGNNIDQMIAIAGSLNRGSFTGWKEQQEGTEPQRHKSASLTARGGNQRAVIKNKYRLKRTNKFYKPSQFDGRTLKSKFQFMMRVLNSRGGGTFFIDEPIPTKRGKIGKGLYLLKAHKITRLQKVGDTKRPDRNLWRSRSLQQLQNNNQINRIWSEQIARLFK